MTIAAPPTVARAISVAPTPTVDLHPLSLAAAVSLAKLDSPTEPLFPPLTLRVTVISSTSLLASLTAYVSVCSPGVSADVSAARSKFLALSPAFFFVVALAAEPLDQTALESSPSK